MLQHSGPSYNDPKVIFAFGYAVPDLCDRTFLLNCSPWPASLFLDKWLRLTLHVVVFRCAATDFPHRWHNTRFLHIMGSKCIHNQPSSCAPRSWGCTVLSWRNASPSQLFPPRPCRTSSDPGPVFQAPNSMPYCTVARENRRDVWRPACWTYPRTVLAACSAGCLPCPLFVMIALQVEDEFTTWPGFASQVHFCCSCQFFWGLARYSSHNAIRS
jgi:hypothetical protein